MKKITALMFAFLMLVTFASAQKTNASAEKATASETSITTDGQKDTTVEYNGIVISIPKGVKATVSKDAKGNIIVSGSDLNGVKIDGETVNSTGKTTLSINASTKVMTVKEGNNVTVTNAKGQTYSVKAGQTTAQAAATVTTAKPAAKAEVVPAFVLPSTESAANQQTVQNVEETLSPSSPR